MTRSLSLATRRYFIEQGTRKCVKGYRFLSFARSLSNKYGKQLLDTSFKKLIHKADEFLGNKITNVVTKSFTIL